MAAENDQSAWLPTPPPPRPARRDSAIDAALRKFDGEEVAPEVKPSRSWVRTHRPQFAVALSAFLLVIIGIPAVMIGTRDQPAPSQEAARAPEASYIPQEPPAAAEEPSPATNKEVTEAAPVAGKPTVSLPAPKSRPSELRLVASEEPAAQTSPPALAAAPPPPPPPAPVASAERDAGGASQDVVVTGSLIRQPNVAARKSEQKVARSAQRAADEIAPLSSMAPAQAYQVFLSRLQSAVRSGDRRSVIAMVAFPLRVNRHEHSRIYSDAQSVERDFDRIFTPHVRRAILDQRPGQLFSRDVGTMIGNGEVWLDERPVGTVRIVAVNL